MTPSSFFQCSLSGNYEAQFQGPVNLSCLGRGTGMVAWPLGADASQAAFGNSCFVFALDAGFHQSQNDVWP